MILRISGRVVTDKRMEEMARLLGLSKGTVVGLLAEVGFGMVYNEAERLAAGRRWVRAAGKRGKERAAAFLSGGGVEPGDLMEALETCAGPLSKIPSGRRREGWVYLLHDESSGACKIGGTTREGRRQKDLAGAHPTKLTEILAVRVSDWREAERACHERFAEFRMNGEWFSTSPEEVRGFMMELPGLKDGEER